MNDSLNHGVYRWLCTATGKSYVGSSQNLAKRKAEHLRKLRQLRHENPKLQNAWNKYGSSAFEWEVLVYCPVSDLLFHEQIAMDAMDVVRNGYNISLIAGAPMRGRTMSAASREKLSVALEGIEKSPEWIERIASAHRGMKRSADACQNISNSLKGRTISESQLRGLAIGQEILKDPVVKSAACKLAWQNSDRKQRMRADAVACYQEALAVYLLNPKLCPVCDDIILPAFPRVQAVNRLKNRLHCSTSCANTTRFQGAANGL